MKTKSLICSIAVVAAAAVQAASPTKGSCEKAAISLTMKATEQSVAVTLTPEYIEKDDGSGSYSSDSYVCYYKMTLKRLKAYTVWLEEEKGAIMIDDIYAMDPTDIEQMPPFAMFSEVTGTWGTRLVMAEDEWAYDPEFPEFNDPASWTYYIRVIGTQGSTAMLHYQEGAALPVGIAENPLVLKVTDTPKVESRGGSPYVFSPGESEFHCQAALAQGRRYLFASIGGTAALPFDILVNGAGKLTPVDTSRLAGYGVTANDAAYYYDTEEAEALSFSFTRPTTNGTTNIKVLHQSVAARPIKNHLTKAIDPKTPGSVTFTPGRVNAEAGYHDPIIDNNLFSFKAVKNTSYLFETTGAATNLLMRLYDEKGNIIAESTMAGDGSFDVRCGFTATAAKTFYVGVAQKLWDDDLDPLLGKPVTMKYAVIQKDEDAARALAPAPAANDGVDPTAVDTTGVGPNELSRTRWSNTFTVAGRKGIVYKMAAVLADGAKVPQTKLVAEAYTLSGKKEVAVAGAAGDINPGAAEPFAFEAKADGVYYVRVTSDGGAGTDYPAYRVHSLGYNKSGPVLGALKVTTMGAVGTWTINKEKTANPSGASVLLPSGTYTVKFSTVKGFGTPAEQTYTVEALKTSAYEVYYGDTYDPKDDKISGKTGSVTHKATSWSMKNAETEKTALARTLWKTDPADCFEIAGKDGYLYYIHLDQDEGTDKDAVFTIVDANESKVYGPVTELSQAELPAAKSKKYYLKVVHKDAAKPLNTSYSLNGHYANVGAVKFSKATATAKDNATSVKLTVNRTAKDGMVRVRYYTVDGTAKKNEQYVPQEGVLEWADRDSKAKTVEIKLIPKLLSIKTGNTDFKVVLEDADGEYPAPITVPECTVTIQNSGKYADAAAAYAAANKTKKATTKDETVSLRGGTYYGVVQTLSTSNGLPALASVTLTVGAKEAGDPSKDTISAKVMLAGKTYTFKTAKGEPAWDEGEPGAGGVFKKKLLLTQKIGTVTVSNELSVTVHDGVPGDWTAAMKEDVSLTMNVPDAKGKGYQANVKYSGGICRQNAKIQKYLDEAYKFAGYYTVALVPGDAVLTSGKALAKDSGLPSGNGYLTVTVDNQGGAKIAGLLTDNTKVSVSATACAIVRDGKSAVIGHSMLVPVYLAKSPYCFGGWLKLTARADSGRPDGQNYKVVVDGLESELLWNNDNAALTYDGKEGWRMALAAVGGWYDKVFNLQAYYNDWAQQFSIDTIQAEGFPKEILASGYRVVTAAQPDDEDVNLAGDKFETAKKTLVKRTDNKKLNDWAQSVNPCNVQVKLTRATGVVTGSCSVWSETNDGSAQKEITGFKHNGVITLDRDNGSGDVLSDKVISAGFLNKSIKIGKRNWAFSVPFNVAADVAE